jgi:acetyl esterase
VSLDPDLAALLTRVNQAPPLSSYPVDQARKAFRALCRLAAERAAPVEVGSVTSIEVAGATGSLPAFVYRPMADGPRPTIAFFHGGGFTIGDTASYDLQVRTLCAQTGAVVVSVDYRLAPEHPFPAGVDDAVAATHWVGDHLEHLGGEGQPLAVAGDSAGGNLAAVVCQQWSGHRPALAAQLLIYPTTDFLSRRPSLEENASGYFLTREDMLWFHRHYVGEAVDLADARLSPLRAGDLGGLPPAVVATAEYDPLRDDGDAYAQALSSAGVPVIHRRYPGMVHGFFGFGPFSRAAQAAIVELCADLRGLLLP